MSERPQSVTKPAAKPLPPLRAAATENGFCVLAGERPWTSPAGAELVLPSLPLAGAVAAEIAHAREAGKPGTLCLDALGLTRLAVTAIDRIAPKREATARALLEFAETDLVCYRAEARSELRARQDAAWQPLVDWLEGTFKARLVAVEGVMPAAQSPLALAALAMALGKYDAFTLAGLGLAVQTAGSLAVGLALTEGRIDAAEAFALAELEETFQNEQWGEDAEALARRRLRGEDLALAERFLRLAGARGSSE